MTRRESRAGLHKVVIYVPPDVYRDLLVERDRSKTPIPMVIEQILANAIRAKQRFKQVGAVAQNVVTCVPVLRRKPVATLVEPGKTYGEDDARQMLRRGLAVAYVTAVTRLPHRKVADLLTEVERKR